MTDRSGDSALKVGLRNQTSRPYVVWVEPWAEDFTLMPGEHLEVVVRGSDDGNRHPYFEMAHHVGCVQVYIEGDVEEWGVFQDGRAIKCGHNRRQDSDPLL